MYRKNESKFAKIALHDIGFGARGENACRLEARMDALQCRRRSEPKVPTEPENDRKNDRQKAASGETRLRMRVEMKKNNAT